MKVCHLTSVHERYDTRIYIKQCRSLAQVGYETALIVADSMGAEIQDGVSIHDVGRVRGRLRRMGQTTRRIFEKAIILDATIYHLHDPELIPIGLKLKQRGKRVIFDAHEDLPKQILTKPYLNKVSSWCLSRIFSYYEAQVCVKFDAIIAATPAIRDKFLRINLNTVDINNFPILGELESPTTAWDKRSPQICYIGGITAIRGIREMVHAMEHVHANVRLQLVGTFSEPGVETEVEAYSGWRYVDPHGFVSREAVKDILAKSMIGIVVFHSVPNHLEAQPNKMFEYMSAGIPIIASDFPLWRKIIDDNHCGICVDPLDVMAIGRAIDFLLEHPREAEAMGLRGKEAVQKQFNWKSEESKLIQLYEQLSKIS